MKKTFIIVINVIIMSAILIFVVLYSGFTSQDSYRRQIEHFVNTTVTMEEAVGYIRASHVLKDTSAHLISPDTLTGMSTRPRQGTADDYAVSYERMDLLNNMDWGDGIGKSINITRAYTNPMNGEQSLAFCNTVTLYDPESEASYDAVLMRIVPISELEKISTGLKTNTCMQTSSA